MNNYALQEQSRLQQIPQTLETGAEKKAKNRKTKDQLSWNRIIIQAVNAYGRLLETEDLEQRLETLEEKLKDGVLIPNGNKR